jgi:hypothetical protein
MRLGLFERPMYPADDHAGEEVLPSQQVPTSTP